jgi:transitional endoplasmic reticulum ATPase
MFAQSLQQSRGIGGNFKFPDGAAANGNAPSGGFGFQDSSNADDDLYS